jgi:lysozyme
MNLGTLLDDIERDEGYRQFVYDDATGQPIDIACKGNPTIGHGLNLRVGFSKEESLQIVAMRLRKIDQHLVQALPWYVSLTGRRRNALCGMAYNMGVTKLLTFRDMCAALNAGDFDTAAAECLDSVWATQVGDRAKRIAQAIKEG